MRRAQTKIGDPKMGQVLELTGGRPRRGPRTEPVVTKREIAARYRVSERTINRWMDRGMPYDKPYEGGSVRYCEQECDAWMMRHR